MNPQEGNNPVRPNAAWGEYKCFALACALAVAIFAVDLNLPLGVAGGVPYVAVILIGWWLPKRSQIFTLAVNCSVLTVAGYFASPEGGVAWIVAVNRLLALFAIWISAVLLFQARKATDSSLKNEALLRESEERLRVVIDNSPSFITVKDLNGKFMLVNQTHTEIFGLSSRDIMGKTCFDFLPQKTAESITAQDREVLETKSIVVEERENPTQQGNRFYIVAKFPILDRYGSVKGVGTIGTDITERKQAEIKVAESEQRFSQVLDNAVSGVITIDDHGIVQSFNRAAEEIFGYAAKDVIGKNIKMLMPGSFATHHDAYIANYVRSGEAKIIGIGREVEGLRKDGSNFPMDLGISELTASGQHLFTGTVTDISERKKWEVDLLAAKEEAEKSNQAKSEFLSSMSHELRTPLNAILGFTQLLNTDHDNPLTEGQVDATEQVLKSGDHLLSLIDEVLDLAQIESGNVALNAEPQDPTPVIDSCATIAGNLAEQKGLEFYDRTQVWNLPEISIDETRFRQVLLNLLSNAVKYNRDGGTVTLSVEETPEGALRLSVVDTGIGIAEEKQAQIFTPFSRLGLENSDITGTGIGLTITKELTEAMGGRIGFESTHNQGSTFWLEFPIAGGRLSVKDRGDKPAAAAVAADDDVVAANVFPAAHTVLCVEDSPSSLKLMETLIGRIPGAMMISAHTGELGIDLAEIHRPDVIMMDINLPGMDGMEALRRLKTSTATKDIPVIALTARASARDRKQGLDAGFEHYLTKPIDIKEVTKAIEGSFEATGLAPISRSASATPPR